MRCASEIDPLMRLRPEKFQTCLKPVSSRGNAMRCVRNSCVIMRAVLVRYLCEIPRQITQPGPLRKCEIPRKITQPGPLRKCVNQKSVRGPPPLSPSVFHAEVSSSVIFVGSVSIDSAGVANEHPECACRASSEQPCKLAGL